jgi:riboflavin synthase
MFTGIVKTKGRIHDIYDHAGIRTLTVQIGPEYIRGIETGASVSLSGVCLTVTTILDDALVFDAIDTTLELTTIGQLQIGDIVNIERSFRIGDEVGGHILSGHISTIATIVLTNTHENNVRMRFEVPSSYMKYILPKGYIAVDGCSLTIVDVLDQTFSVSFIPETLRLTTFGKRDVGDLVNIEFDTQTVAIVDTVERVMASRS